MFGLTEIFISLFFLCLFNFFHQPLSDKPSECPDCIVPFDQEAKVPVVVYVLTNGAELCVGR